MNLVDIIALAKAGYKKADIKELMELDIPDQKVETVETSTVDNKANFLSTDEASAVVGEEPKAAAEDSQDKEEIDYKKLYEESQAKLAKVTNDLKAAQKQNVRQPIEDNNVTDDDLINDLANAFI